MAREEIIRKIAKEVGIRQKDVDKVIKLFFDEVALALKKNKKFIMPGILSAKIAERKAKVGVNPRTKEKIQIPAKKVIKIKAGKNFEQKVFG